MARGEFPDVGGHIMSGMLYHRQQQESRLLNEKHRLRNDITEVSGGSAGDMYTISANVHFL